MGRQRYANDRELFFPLCHFAGIDQCPDGDDGGDFLAIRGRGPDVGDGRCFIRGLLGRLANQLVGQFLADQHFFGILGSQRDGCAGTHHNTDIRAAIAIQGDPGTQADGRTIQLATLGDADIGGSRMGGRHGDKNRGDDFPALQGGEARATEKFVQRQAAGPVGSGDVDRRVQRDQGRRVIGRGGGVAQVAHHGAHVADLNIGGGLGGLGHGGIVLANHWVAGHIGQQRRGADGQSAFFVKGDRVQTVNAFQADELFGKQRPVANLDHQVGAAGHDTGVLAALDQCGNRLVYSCWGDIVEMGCWHYRCLLFYCWDFIR
ncbi:hypothetical protein DESC_870032 [Desulfosarcina cetonica]|nr:hypothetical protein DESC_870032 [Desulfosarcina cetonica]